MAHGHPALCCRACAAPQWEEKATQAIALSPGKSWAGRAHEASRARGQAAPLCAADPHSAIATHSLLFPPGFPRLSLPYHTLFTWRRGGVWAADSSSLKIIHFVSSKKLA